LHGPGGLGNQIVDTLETNAKVAGNPELLTDALSTMSGDDVLEVMGDASAKTFLVVAPLSGPKATSVSAVPAEAARLSFAEPAIAELTPRAKALGKGLVDAGIVNPMRGHRLPVGVTQPNVPGTPRVVTVGDMAAYEAIESGRFALEPGEVLGPRPAFDARGRLLPESHVECLGARYSTEQFGATGGWIGTTPKQCPNCASAMDGSGWCHTNPK